MMISRTKKLHLRTKKIEDRQQDLLVAGSLCELADVLFGELSEALPSFELIKEIVEKDNLVLTEKRKRDGSNALHVVCFNENAMKEGVIIEYLLSFSSSTSPSLVKQKNNHGLVPLHKVVCITKCPEQFNVVKMLTEADLSALSMKTNDGHTPLHLAISSPKMVYYEMIQYFLELNGQLALISDLFGHLPIHKACSRSKETEVELIMLLVEYCPSSVGMKDLRG
jgi:ankyrin repeat protein